MLLQNIFLYVSMSVNTAALERKIIHRFPTSLLQNILAEPVFKTATGEGFFLFDKMLKLITSWTKNLLMIGFYFFYKNTILRFR